MDKELREPFKLQAMFSFVFENIFGSWEVDRQHCVHKYMFIKVPKIYKKKLQD